MPLNEQELIMRKAVKHCVVTHRHPRKYMQQNCDAAFTNSEHAFHFRALNRLTIWQLKRRGFSCRLIFTATALSIALAAFTNKRAESQELLTAG
jgi:hypothetical protein